MTSNFTNIGGVLLFMLAVILLLSQPSEPKQDDGLSLKQTLMSADKLVKSLSTDDKIVRAVENAKTDKKLSRKGSPVVDHKEEEDEDEEEEDSLDNAEENRGREKARREDKSNKGPKIWDQWSKWSACSVTCGIGKITRWRHCVSGGCAAGEKEAQIKTCTLPAC